MSFVFIMAEDWRINIGDNSVVGRRSRRWRTAISAATQAARRALVPAAVAGGAGVAYNQVPYVAPLIKVLGGMSYDPNPERGYLWPDATTRSIPWSMADAPVTLEQIRDIPPENPKSVLVPYIREMVKREIDRVEDEKKGLEHKMPALENLRKRIAAPNWSAEFERTRRRRRLDMDAKSVGDKRISSDLTGFRKSQRKRRPPGKYIHSERGGPYISALDQPVANPFLPMSYVFKDQPYSVNPYFEPLVEVVEPMAVEEVFAPGDRYAHPEPARYLPRKRYKNVRSVSYSVGVPTTRKRFWRRKRFQYRRRK